MTRQPAKPVPVTYKKKKLPALFSKAQTEVQTVPAPALKKVAKKNKVQPKKEKLAFVWHCPVCAAIFLSEKTKKRHIQIHGTKSVTKALARKSAPVKPKRVSAGTSNRSVGSLTIASNSNAPSKKRSSTRAKGRSVSVVKHIPFREKAVRKNMCWVCGVTPPMPGERSCYGCHSK